MKALLLAGLGFVAGIAWVEPEITDAQEAAIEAQHLASDFAEAAEKCLASVDRYLEPIPHDGPACRPILTTRDNP